MKSFEELECWKIGAEIRREVSSLVKKLPSQEKFALISQMLRCSRSVTNNIAEGYGRFHYQEDAQFCRHARGSLYELIDHLIICFEEQYIDQTLFENLKSKCFNCIKILNGYIKYLLEAKMNQQKS